MDIHLRFLLGYLTPKQWADALTTKGCNKKIIESYLNGVDKMYPGIKEMVDEEIKKVVVKRLEGK